jgi:hypothetical protein
MLPPPPADVPFVPTSAEPGSAEKVEVMIERYQRRHPLFHPLDPRLIVKHRGSRYYDWQARFRYVGRKRHYREKF